MVAINARALRSDATAGRVTDRVIPNDNALKGASEVRGVYRIAASADAEEGGCGNHDPPVALLPCGEMGAPAPLKVESNGGIFRMRSYVDRAAVRHRQADNLGRKRRFQCLRSVASSLNCIRGR